MNHRLEVADVFRSSGIAFLDRYGLSLSLEQHRAFRAIMACRTSLLGGHIQKCTSCELVKQAYNSCRNRHCPKCQASARAAWLEARSSDLLPVPYFHVVFTLPKQLGQLAIQNKRIVYGALFRAAWETLRDLAHDPKHLGANIGMLAVLHTWGSNLHHHPHLHCVVPGGGISAKDETWVSIRHDKARRAFLLPVKVMSRVFRGKFIEMLKAAYSAGELNLIGKIEHLRSHEVFEKFLNSSVKTDWVVYCKRPFGGPDQVLKYLARYTHRVAISNSRLVGIDKDKVRFRWKDYRNQNETKTMQLDGSEFIRRFMMHVLPKGFVRIRHYGLLSNRNRAASLELCRGQLGVETSTTDACGHDDTILVQDDSDADLDECPACNSGKLMIIQLIWVCGVTTRQALRSFQSNQKFQDSS